MNERLKHWMFRAGSLRKLRLAGIAILIVSVVAELFITLHSYFDVADFFAFHAVLGFMACVIMVLFARLLGYLVKRRDDYYDR